jgi:hypothetical protein
VETLHESEGEGCGSNDRTHSDFEGCTRGAKIAHAANLQSSLPSCRIRPRWRSNATIRCDRDNRLVRAKRFGLPPARFLRPMRFSRTRCDRSWVARSARGGNDRLDDHTLQVHNAWRAFSTTFGWAIKGGMAVKDHAKSCHLLPRQKRTTRPANSSYSFLCDHMYHARATWQTEAILPNQRSLMSRAHREGFRSLHPNDWRTRVGSARVIGTLQKCTPKASDSNQR